MLMLFQCFVEIFELVDDVEEGGSRDALGDNKVAFFEKVAHMLRYSYPRDEVSATLPGFQCVRRLLKKGQIRYLNVNSLNIDELTWHIVRNEVRIGDRQFVAGGSTAV
jgi:hypothetical protein